METFLNLLFGIVIVATVIITFWFLYDHIRATIRERKQDRQNREAEQYLHTDGKKYLIHPEVHNGIPYMVHIGEQIPICSRRTWMELKLRERENLK